MLRLLAMLGAIGGAWVYYTHREIYQAILTGLSALLFFLLMKMHHKASEKRLFTKTLLQINEEELAYLEHGTLSFSNGDGYSTENHAYAADLDMLGPRSLYQHLNRTATQMGKGRLAAAFMDPVPFETIKANQEAVAELAQDLENRHIRYAYARIAEDNKDIYTRLLQWSQQKDTGLNPVFRVLAYVLPALLAASLVLYGITRQDLYWTLATRLFPLNLIVFSFALGKIRKAIAGAGKVHEMLKAYAAIFRQIESASFTTQRLKALQQQLEADGIKASSQVQRLGKILSGMETVQNPFAAVFMNGLYLYHIHVLYQLLRWKKAYAAHIVQWLNVIGEMEMLHSLANLYYNNPDFCFPELNTEHRISFRALGHPLIAEHKRICNDITFDQHRFIVLTGSNMSGKSTFLRTLGINMVLAGMGAPVCAAAAQVHPLRVFVSMRQSDSLADNESYFFAEVKRLKYVMDQLQQEVCFVLLDEILRGTNSDDKRSGTIGVIGKIIDRKAIGVIATHDLEVCQTTYEHPDILINKCFEAEIIQNELVFDYRLRDGICRNKSATFLMKKMEII